MDLENLNLENRNADLMIQIHELQNSRSSDCDKCHDLVQQNSVLSSQLEWLRQQLVTVVKCSSDSVTISDNSNLNELVEALSDNIKLEAFPDDYIKMIDCIEAKVHRISTLVTQARSSTVTTSSDKQKDDDAAPLAILQDIYAVWRKPWNVHWPLAKPHHGTTTNSTTTSSEWKEDATKSTNQACPVFGIRSAEVEAVLSAWTTDEDKKQYTRRWLNTIASDKLTIETAIEFTDLSLEVLDAFRMLLIPLLRQCDTTDIKVHTKTRLCGGSTDNNKLYDLRLWAIPIKKKSFNKSRKSIIEERLERIK